jgi:hypothetical protein
MLLRIGTPEEIAAFDRETARLQKEIAMAQTYVEPPPPDNIVYGVDFANKRKRDRDGLARPL